MRASRGDTLKTLPAVLVAATLAGCSTSAPGPVPVASEVPEQHLDPAGAAAYWSGVAEATLRGVEAAPWPFTREVFSEWHRYAIGAAARRDGEAIRIGAPRATWEALRAAVGELDDADRLAVAVMLRDVHAKTARRLEAIACARCTWAASHYAARARRWEAMAE